MMPASATPRVSRVVATGRRMNGSEMLTASRSRQETSRGRVLDRPFDGAAAAQAARQPVETEIDHRRREQGEELTHDQAADDRDAERMAQLRAGAGADHQRQRAE